MEGSVGLRKTTDVLEFSSTLMEQRTVDARGVLVEQLNKWKSFTGSVSCGAARNLITLPDYLFIYHVLATAFKYFCFLFKQNWNINWYSSWCYSREGIQGPVAIKTLFQIFPFSTDDSFESCTGNSLEILFCIWIFSKWGLGVISELMANHVYIE